MRPIFFFLSLFATFVCYSNAKLLSGITLPTWALSLPVVQGTACTCRAASVDHGDHVTTPVTAECRPIDDSLPISEPDSEYRCGCGTYANNLTCWQMGTSMSSELVNVDSAACDLINVTSTSTSDSATVAPQCLDANGKACGNAPGMQTYTTRSYALNLQALSCSVTVLRIQCTTPACSPGPVNCLLGSFTDWSPCQLSPTGNPYKSRYKPVIHDGANGGTLCSNVADRCEEQSCSDTELLPLRCSYVSTSVSSACSSPCGHGTYTITTYNISQVTKPACAVSEEIISTTTLPCATNRPCADASLTQPVNYTCNYTGNTGFRDADVLWIGVNFGGNISTNMTMTQLGRSFAVSHSISKRPFSLVASATSVSGTTVILKVASYGLDLEGSTGHPLELAYIPPTHGNATLLVNDYPPIGFVCVPRDYSAPVIVEALYDNGTALVYFSEDVRACSDAGEVISTSSLGLSGITPTSELIKWSNRVWYFRYTGYPTSIPTLSPSAGVFCDLNSNPNAVPSSPVTFFNQSLERSYWTMYTGGEHSCKVYSNSSSGLIDTLVVVSMIPFLRSAIESSFRTMFGFTSYALYTNTSVYDYRILLVDRLLFESDDTIVNSFVLTIQNGFVPNEGYYHGYGTQFPTYAPQISVTFRLGTGFTGFSLPPGLPYPSYGNLNEVYPLDRSIPRLKSAIAAVGQTYVNVTFTHPRQVGNFHLYEFEFVGPIVPVAITAVHNFITVQLETAAAITFSDLQTTRLAFNGYIQYDTQSELYRNQVWRDYINITNIDPKRPSVLYAELKHVGSGLFFDQIYFYFDEVVYESDAGLGVTISSSIHNLTIEVTSCVVYEMTVGCDVLVTSLLHDRAYTQSDDIALGLSGVVDAYGNEMNPFHTLLVYDKSAPSLKTAFLSPNATSIILVFSEPINGSFDTSGYELTPAPISCAQTSPISIECYYGQALGADVTISFGDGSSVTDVFGNAVRPVLDLPVIPNALVVVQNKCSDPFGLPDSWFYPLAIGALIGWAFVLVMFVSILVWVCKKGHNKAAYDSLRQPVVEFEG